MRKHSNIVLDFALNIVGGYLLESPYPVVLNSSQSVSVKATISHIVYRIHPGFAYINVECKGAESYGPVSMMTRI